MWNQARNNRKIVRPTPAVPNTTCVITRSQLQWRLPILACPFNKCVPRSAHVVVPENQGTHYVAHTWRLNFPANVYYGCSLVTNSHAIQSRILQNTATNTKYYNISLQIWPVLSYYSIFFSFFFWTKWTTKYIQTRSNTNTKGSSVMHKRGEISKIVKLQSQIMQALCLWKAHLKYWSGTTITPTPTRLSGRSGCCQSRRKTGVLY